MYRNYNIGNLLVAYILAWSLCLQGCNRLATVSIPDAKIVGADLQERTNLSEGGQPKDTPSDTIVHQHLPGRMLFRAELLKALEEKQETFHNQIVQATEAKQDSEQQEKEQEGNEQQENQQNACLEGFVRLMGIGNHLITQNKAYEILSLNAYQDECKKNEKGNHPVVRIGDVYFKANRGLGGAITPGMEQAMYLLQNLLVGQGITPSALLSLSDVLLYQENADMPVDLDLVRAINEQKRAIFFEKNPAFKQYLTLEKTSHLVQVTQSVKGDSFAAFLDQVRQHKRSFDEIDNASLSAHLLTSFVVNYYDAHGDNLMVTRSGSIVGIDNDMALAYPLIHFFSSPSRCSEHYVGARNIFYCIAELMRRPIDATIRQRILSLSAEELVLTWLGLLEKTNMNYQKLQAQGAFQAEEATKLGLPIKLAPKIGSFLLGRLNRIKTYLRDYPDLTHIRLLTLLDPLVGLHYQTLWERFQDPLEVAVRIFPGSNQVVSLEQTLNMRARLNDGRLVFRALREERDTRQAHKNHIQTPTQEAQSLLQTIDLKTHLPAIQSHILQCAGEYFPEELSQHAHASWKDPYLIEEVMAGELDEAVMGTLGLLGITLPAETRSLLHEAIQKSHSLKLIGELIRQGCSVNQRHEKVTPLEVAMEHDNKEVVTFLIEQGAKEVAWRTALAYFGRLQEADGTHRKAFQRLEDTNPEISWRRTVDVLLPTTGAGIPIQTATMGERVLPRANHAQLFDKKGNIKRINKNGRRNVGRIEQGNYCLYVKEYPELPGMEEAVRLLMRSIVGHGVPYGGIIRVGSKPYYISQGVPGETLQEVLEKYPKRLQQLDSQRLSEMIIGSMLNNPEDGNPTNYIVQQLPSGLYVIEGVDNDHAFGETVAREKQGIATQVKCILFCLDQMQEKVHPKAMETFKNFNPADMLKWWLTELSSLNTCYGELFKPAETKALMTKSESFMGVAFTPKMLSRLYEKMVRLQRFLHKADESVTHLQLLNHMEPRLYKKYKAGFETEWDPRKGAAPWQRFLDIDGPFYGRTKGGALLTSTSLKQFLTSLDIPIKKEILDVIRAGGHIGPNMALMELQEMIQQISQEVTNKSIETFKVLKTHKQKDEFLKQLDFKSMPFTDQQAWIAALKSFEDHRTLRVRNCVVLSNKDFEKGGFYMGNLRKLDLAGAENLEESIFPLLATEAVGLTHLNLKGLKKVTRIEGKINKQGFIRQTVTKEPLVFQNLAWLNISQYLVLTSIAFEAPHLFYLKAKGCSKLVQIAIQARLLKSLDIRKATLLTDEVLDRQLSNWPVLKNLRLKGCKAISWHAIRQASLSCPEIG